MFLAVHHYMKSVEVYVATHKKMGMILPDYCKYIQVNANKQGQWKGYLHDNDLQDNISNKNNSYSELTALYALWKNSTADIGGLFHYRRYLTGKTDMHVRNECRMFETEKELVRHIITPKRVIALLDHSEVILGMPTGPLPLTAFEDLQKFVYINDIWIMIDTIEEEYPEYKKALWEILFSNRTSYCNIFIAGREFIDKYCTWLFEILARIEAKVDVDGYDKSHQRIFGYLAEVLLNVYVRYNKTKTEYVYRVDLLEGNLLQKTILKMQRGVNSVLSISGMYPLALSRRIYKARYLSCKGTSTEFDFSKALVSGEIDRVRKYFEKCSCAVSCVDVNGRYYRINANGFLATVNFFNCNKREYIHEVEQIIDEENMTEKEFGVVAAYRIFCLEGIAENDSQRLLRKGITIVGYYPGSADGKAGYN